ncbi:hypothetical protein MKI84_02965 [Ancylobacter sp. A5.8]|uniref:hypothetical protein n=1 Tax=Ancylobacter gelatini TaxID=2919920 RepID=UPI001F4E1B3D|nr:hypothetical protein [Ancylobacter gelatini]MCJ8141866.1 hypothetical protein [Ancylobacter gelatini]
MTRLFTALLALLMLASSGRGQEGLSPIERSSIDALIGQAMADFTSGQPHRTSISSSLSAQVTPGLIMSKATGRPCTRCKDMCRDYTLEIVRDAGLSTSTYAGERCMTVPASLPNEAPWQDRRRPTLVGTKWQVAPETLAEARGYLTALMYLPDDAGISPRLILRALDEFRQDAGLPRPLTVEITARDWAALREVVGRSTMSGGCSASAPNSACGRLN